MSISGGLESVAKSSGIKYLLEKEGVEVFSDQIKLIQRCKNLLFIALHSCSYHVTADFFTFVAINFKFCPWQTISWWWILTKSYLHFYKKKKSKTREISNFPSNFFLCGNALSIKQKPMLCSLTSVFRSVWFPWLWFWFGWRFLMLFFIGLLHIQQWVNFWNNQAIRKHSLEMDILEKLFHHCLVFLYTKPLLKWVYLKVKEFVPWGANSCFYFVV